jgi:hypothetical protein
MKNSSMYRLSVLLFCVILAACSANAPAPTTVPSVPAEPTATSAASGPIAPTAGRPAEPLPAALYTLDQGQIFRIERDGITRTRITEETTAIDGFPPIATFAVSTAGNLAYVVGDLEADRLVITGPDGAEATVRYSEMNHELSNLVWSPDGSALVLRLLNNRQPPDLPSGVYRLDPRGGELELLVADDPVDDLVNPSPDIAAYRPFAWSPDGAQLLLEVYSPFYFTCGPGVLPAEGGNVTRVALPEGVTTYCGEASWAPDSSTILFMAGPASEPTIWRASLAGDAAPLGAAVGLSRAPFALADNAARMISGTFDAAGNPAFTMVEFVDTAAPLRTLRPATNDRPTLLLWADTGAGAAALIESPEGQLSLRWLPADGAESVSLPATRSGVTELRWGEYDQ